MLHDLNNISKNFTIEGDVCIVGSGAAGLAIAFDLNNTRYKVVVLESGGFDFENGTQSPYNIVDAGDHTLETLTSIRGLGGTLNMWGGALKLLDEIDFEKRCWLPYSGWPLTYAELAKYWNIAANRYQLPPLHFYQIGHWLPHIEIRDERKLLHKNMHISIINTLAKPLNFRADYYNEFVISRNIHIYLHANAAHLQLNDSCKKIQAVKAKSIDGKLLTCKAKYFILAAGGIENARLLLNSRDKMTTGIGNQNDLVGRFYMNHPKGDFGLLVPFDKGIQLPHFWESSSPYGRILMGLSPSRSLMEREHLLNHWIQLVPVYEYEALPGYRSVTAVRYIFGKRRMRSWMSRQVKNLLNRTPKLGRLSHIVIHNRLEQAPNPDSRVFLSNKPDVFGNKKVALDWRISSVEKESIKKFHDVLRYAYKKIGEIHSSFEEIERWPISTDAAHHMGTTRMALSEKDGVVDKDCKVFGLDNLFVAGSCVFPTGGNANPTFTILALSLRLADHLKRKLSS